MTVKTTQVAGRRSLRFSSYQDIVDEARRLSGIPTRQLGNWSLGQICEHLAKGMDMAIEASSKGLKWTLEGSLLFDTYTRHRKPERVHQQQFGRYYRNVYEAIDHRVAVAGSDTDHGPDDDGDPDGSDQSAQRCVRHLFDPAEPVKRHLNG